MTDAFTWLNPSSTDTEIPHRRNETTLNTSRIITSSFANCSWRLESAASWWRPDAERHVSSGVFTECKRCASLEVRATSPSCIRCVLEWWARRAKRGLTLCRPRQRPARWSGWRPGPSRRRLNWTSCSPVTHTHTDRDTLTLRSLETIQSASAEQRERRALEKKKHLIKNSHYLPLWCHIVENNTWQKKPQNKQLYCGNKEEMGLNNLVKVG